MKLRVILAVAALALIAACGGPEEQEKGSISVSPVSVNATAEKGSYDIQVNANKHWEAKADQSWVTVTPSKGDGSGVVKVTVGENEGDARSAKVTFGFLIDPAKAELSISQASGVPDDGIRKLTVEQFRALKDDAQTWYRLTGEVISIADEEFGDLYLMDDTGYIYVYGLASEKGGANEDFPKLGIRAGDRITIIAHKKTYNDIIETDKAYLENRQSGTYPGIKADKALSAYIELPATSEKDGLVYVCHYDGQGKRNYSAYFDTGKRLSSWVCYPYCSSDKNDTRPDSYAYDPLIESKYQANLKKSFQKRTFDGEEFVRGHMLPNASRGGRRQLDAFLSTNIMPQSSAINTGIWSSLESAERENWVKKCDTLYVVVGTDSSQSKYQVEDNSSTPKKITVPNAIYRAVLAYDKKDNTYKGLAAYFENKKNSSTEFVKTLPNTMLMSIDKLEEKLGIDFFPNLPDDIEKAVEAANPAEESFWWN